MKPKLRIFDDLEKISIHAANLFSRQAVRSARRFLVALNGGGTPTRLFQLLATDLHEKVEWAKVHIFWGDERCVPPEDAGSSYGQARELLLSKIPIPESNIHCIRGELPPVEAAREYSHILQEYASHPLDWPRFDLVYLGMGEDGHTASLFPGSPVHIMEAVLPVTAHYQDRPANRVTLTQLVFNSAHMVVFMAAGEKKASTLAEVLSDRYNPELYPAQRIDPKDGELIWLVDKDAAGNLPKKITRKYCEG